MRSMRFAATLIVAGVALAAVTTAVQAGLVAPSRADADPVHIRLDQGAAFTRIQTVTLLTSPVATATALTTSWENTWVDLNVPFGITVPSDFFSVTVEGAAAQILTDSISLIPSGTQPVYLRYFTNSSAAREGNQFRIFIRATSPETSTYLTSVVFDDATYDFISYQNNPSDTLALGVPFTSTGRVWWGPITVAPQDRFDKYVALIDERLPIDLAIDSFGATMAGDRNSVQVTATLVNSGTVETGNLFYIEFYDRPAGAPAPSGPDDHLWGVCPDVACSYFRSANYEYHPHSGESPLMPGETKLITFNYTFGTGGDRDLYIQVDSFGFGSVYGLVYEAAGESNNIRYLKTVQAVGKTYLPLVLKNH